MANALLSERLFMHFVIELIELNALLFNAYTLRQREGERIRITIAFSSLSLFSLFQLCMTV